MVRDAEAVQAHTNAPFYMNLFTQGAWLGTAFIPCPENVLTGKLRTATAKTGNPDFVAMYAGQAAPLSRTLPAAELVATLEAEAIECLDRLIALGH